MNFAQTNHAVWDDGWNRWVYCILGRVWEILNSSFTARFNNCRGTCGLLSVLHAIRSINIDRFNCRSKHQRLLDSPYFPNGWSKQSESFRCRNWLPPAFRLVSARMIGRIGNLCLETSFLSLFSATIIAQRSSPKSRNIFFTAFHSANPAHLATSQSLGGCRQSATN